MLSTVSKPHVVHPSSPRDKFSVRNAQKLRKHCVFGAFLCNKRKAAIGFRVPGRSGDRKKRMSSGADNKKYTAEAVMATAVLFSDSSPPGGRAGMKREVMRYMQKLYSLLRFRSVRYFTDRHLILTQHHIARL